MPELPDIELYRTCLESRVVGARLTGVRLAHPFLLRSVEPPVAALDGRLCTGTRRIGKRIALAFEDDLFAVLHLMIAGRLQWKQAGAPVPARLGLAAFDFESGTLLLTEAGKKRRARLHIVRGEAALATHDPGGMEVLGSTVQDFAERLRLRNHTLKRALTDPRLFSGIGNAYSDEVLFDARISPVKSTTRLSDEEVQRLHASIHAVMTGWRDRLVQETGEGWPTRVTAFRPEMTVHGKHKEPCTVCGKPIQRIRYANNECNYCARCQNADRLLADRGLSRLLKKDWPRTLEELEEKLAGSEGG